MALSLWFVVDRENRKSKRLLDDDNDARQPWRSLQVLDGLAAFFFSTDGKVALSKSRKLAKICRTAAAAVAAGAVTAKTRTGAEPRRGHRAKTARSSVAGSAQGVQKAVNKERVRENQRERDWLASIGLPGRALAQKTVLALAKTGPEKEEALAFLRRFHSLSEPLRRPLSQHWSRAALLSPAAFERLDAVALRALGQAGVAWGESLALREVAARRVRLALMARDTAAMEAVAGFWGEGRGLSAQQALACASAVQTSDDGVALGRALPSAFFCDRTNACAPEAPQIEPGKKGLAVFQGAMGAASQNWKSWLAGGEDWRSATPTPTRRRSGSAKKTEAKNDAWSRLLDAHMDHTLHFASDARRASNNTKGDQAQNGLAQELDGAEKEIAQETSRRASLFWGNLATRAGVRAAWRLSWAGGEGGLGVWSWGEWAWRCSRADAWPAWLQEASAARAALREAAILAHEFELSMAKAEAAIERGDESDTVVAVEGWAETQAESHPLVDGQALREKQPVDREAERVERLRLGELSSQIEARASHAGILCDLLEAQDGLALWALASLGLANNAALSSAENHRKMKLLRRAAPFMVILDEFGYYGAGMGGFGMQMNGLKSLYYSHSGIRSGRVGVERIRPLWAIQKTEKNKIGMLLSAPKERPRPDGGERIKGLAAWQERAWQEACAATISAAAKEEKDGLNASAGACVDCGRGEREKDSHELEEWALEDALEMVDAPWSALAQKALLNASAGMDESVWAGNERGAEIGQEKAKATRSTRL